MAAIPNIWFRILDGLTPRIYQGMLRTVFVLTLLLIGLVIAKTVWLFW